MSKEPQPSPNNSGHFQEETPRSFDPTAWEERWARMLGAHPELVAGRKPNHHLVAALTSLPIGRALDAGCGTGVDAIWLANRGWQVTALDFSASALAHGCAAADAAGHEISSRINWVHGDLGTLETQPPEFDLVLCLFVHAHDSVKALIKRMAHRVALGGSLFMVGQTAFDSSTGAATAAADQQQITVRSAQTVLSPDLWDLVAIDERPRAKAGTGADVVVHVVRRA